MIVGCNFQAHCTKVPMPQKCVPYCLERILRNANIEEKQLILRLGPELSQSIYNAYNGFKDIRSFRDLRSALRPDEIEVLLDTFSNISQSQLDYFHKSREEKERIIRDIRERGMDSDNDLPLPL